MSIYAERGVPGCIGCIDCKIWKSQNCHKALAGMFTGKDMVATVVLEVIADSDGWIWCMYFRIPGSLNDINILDSSTKMQGIVVGDFPPL